MGDHSVYRRRALKLGANVERLVLMILRQGEGFIDTRKVWGILSLDKSYSPERIDEACGKALAMESPRYRTVKSLLELSAEPEGKKSNIATRRSREYKFVRPLSVYGEQLPLLEPDGSA